MENKRFDGKVGQVRKKSKLKEINGSATFSLHSLGMFLHVLVYAVCEMDLIMVLSSQVDTRYDVMQITEHTACHIESTPSAPPCTPPPPSSFHLSHVAMFRIAEKI